MSAKAFVDTNILIYAYDQSSGTKHEQARGLVRELWEYRNGALSTQILQEFAFYLRRKVARPLSAKQTRQTLEEYLNWQIIVNTAASTVQALEIEERYGISFWDALVVHAAQAAGAEILYSEDLSDGQSYGSVRVINPFKSKSSSR